MDAFVTEAFTLLSIGLVTIGLRLWTRLDPNTPQRIWLDDYIMIVAAVAYSAETALAYSVGAYWRGLANNSMTDEQRLALSQDPNSEEYILRVNGSKTQLAGWSTYTFLLWLIKASMCAFFMRLADGLQNFRRRIYFGWGLLGITWIAVLFSILFGCGLPFKKNWQIYPDPGNSCQPAISNIDIFVTLILNVVTDLYLMFIPIPIIGQARLPPLKKAGLSLLFMGGLFVAVAGILRCVLILSDPVQGAQAAGSWAVRETFVAVMTSNLPVLYPWIRKKAAPVLGSLIRTTKGDNSSQISGMPLSGMSSSDAREPGYDSSRSRENRVTSPAVYPSV